MGFQKQKLRVNGVDVVMLTAGQGEPLLILHGAGTWHGFDFALPWAADFRVMIPYHPGWGESGDDPAMTTVHDYVMHYLEFIDQLGLDRVHLLGISMGGRLAATFTAEHRRRVAKLVLVAPAGLEAPGYPTADFSTIPPHEIPAYLAHDPAILTPHLQNAGAPEWQAARAREGGNFFKLLGTGLLDPHFARFLHRINVPTMIVWGEADRVTPIQQSGAWLERIPAAEVRRYPEAGHLVLDEHAEAVQNVSKFLRA
jgi:pimeloyl-ACP methyl ester carboxylesterase